jgi:hypothetical protein
MSSNYANTSAARAAQSTLVYSVQHVGTSHYAEVDTVRDPIAHYGDVNVFVDVGQLQMDMREENSMNNTE